MKAVLKDSSVAKRSLPVPYQTDHFGRFKYRQREVSVSRPKKVARGGTNETRAIIANDTTAARVRVLLVNGPILNRERLERILNECTT